MKRFALLLVIISLVFVWTTKLSAEDAKVGRVAFVDLSRLFDSYKKTEKYDQELEKQKEAKQAERDKKVKEIKKLQDRLALLNDKEKAKTQDSIDAKLEKLREFDDEASRDLMKERNDLLQEILKEIQDSINEFSAKENFMLIFNDRVLLYGAAELDITDELIKIINEKYSKKK